MTLKQLFIKVYYNASVKRAGERVYVKVHVRSAAISTHAIPYLDPSRNVYIVTYGM